MPPRLTIVLSTRNRAVVLPRNLEALGRQTAPPEDYEVLVVADGCTDDTAAVVRSFRAPFALRLIEQPATGLAAARNRGASEAAAPLVMFYDDDMEAAPEMVAAHIAAHEAHPGGVVLGYFPLPDLDDRADVFLVAAKLWWDEGFADRAGPAHRFDLTDFCGGNVSLPRDLFDAVGGFDPVYCGISGEDYDLGARLLKRGVRFRFERAAASTHHDRPNERRALYRARQDGHAHAVMAGKFPELFPVFKLARLARFSSRPLVRPLWRLLWWQPRLADAMALMLRGPFRLTKALGLWGLMWRFYGGLDGYFYWRGVRDALGSLAAWESLERRVPRVLPANCEVEIDVATDLPRLAEILGRAPADAAVLRYRGTLLGRIDPIPGAEALRPEHIHAELHRAHSAFLLSLILLDRAGTDPEPRGPGCAVNPRDLESSRPS